MMKKAVVALSVLFWAVILFFTAFGESLYHQTNPNIETDYSISVNGETYLPESAVFSEQDGDYVYTVESREGFSQEILTVVRHRLTEYLTDDSGYFEGYVKIYPEEDIRGVFVISSSVPLYDGAKVVEKE